jgi:hypothetical protein
MSTSSDVRLALDAVQDKELGVAGTRLHQFLRGRKYGATKADNAAVEYAQEQIGRSEGPVVLDPGVGYYLIFAVTLDDDARCFVAVPPGNRPPFDRDDCAGRRCVNGCAHFTVGFGNKLSFQDAVTNSNNRLRRFANVLFNWQDELCGNWYVLNWFCRRLALMAWQAQAAMELAEVIGRCAHDRGLIAMQSTGQGATHSSQPVHSLAITVCMNWCAPTMASTGHAFRQ